MEMNWDMSGYPRINDWCIEWSWL